MVACEIEVGCFLGETLGAFGFQGLFFDDLLFEGINEGIFKGVNEGINGC